MNVKKFLFVLVSFFSFAWVLAAVNINTASTQELESLPGIGPVKARAIEDYRRANGSFKSVEDITKVKGIGPATYEKLKNDIMVDGSTRFSSSKHKHVDEKLKNGSTVDGSSKSTSSSKRKHADEKLKNDNTVDGSAKSSTPSKRKRAIAATESAR